jgi:hypothetical protein
MEFGESLREVRQRQKETDLRQKDWPHYCAVARLLVCDVGSDLMAGESHYF